MSLLSWEMGQVAVIENSITFDDDRDFLRFLLLVDDVEPDGLFGCDHRGGLEGDGLEVRLRFLDGV